MRIKSFIKFYSYCIIILPLLYQYSLFGILDLDVVVVILLFLLSVLGGAHSRSKYIKYAVITLIYIVAITIFNLFFGYKYSDSTSIFLRCGRYCLYFYVVMILDLSYFEYTYAMRIYRLIAYISFIYISIQAVMYYGRGIMTGRIIGVGRLRAFYSEPAALTYTLVPFIVCSLFGNQYKLKDSGVLDAAITSFCVLLSTSGQGIISVFIIWIIWSIHQIRGGKLRVKQFLILLIAGGIALFVSRSSIFEFAIGRITNSGNAGAVSARSSGYDSLKILNPVQLVFGTGYGNYITKNVFGINTLFRYIYYSSLAEYLFTIGIIGTTLIVVPLFKRFKEGTIYVKVLLIITAVLSLGGAPLTATYLPLYYSFTFYNEKKEIVPV